MAFQLGGMLGARMLPTSLRDFERSWGQSCAAFIDPLVKGRHDVMEERPQDIVCKAIVVPRIRMLMVPVNVGNISVSKCG